LRRSWDKPWPSDSARRKATIEIDRAVRKWAATPEARTTMRAAARYERAHDAWSLGIAIGDALRHEREARSDRLQAVRALCELSPERTPRYSPLSPARAIGIYCARLRAVVDEISAGDASDLDRPLTRLAGLARLARAQEGSPADPDLWDALTALLEAADE
jgi:hypothetical protein